VGRVLRSWLPAFLWAAVIFVLSTDSFSAEHTGSILNWLMPNLSHEQFVFLHHLIRKTAHFSEYFIFYLFLYRALRGQRTGWRWSWGFGAWVLAAGYSALDEIHQAFVASRTASPYDSLLDSVGALAAFLVVLFWFQLRQTPPGDLTEKPPGHPLPSAPAGN
jgi:VanZ family protein